MQEMGILSRIKSDRLGMINAKRIHVFPVYCNYLDAIYFISFSDGGSA